MKIKKVVFGFICCFLVLLISCSIGITSFINVKANTNLENDSKTHFVGYSDNMEKELLHNKTRLSMASESSPVITILVHGQSGDASHFSHKSNWKFGYEQNSIGDLLSKKLNYLTNIYLAQFDKETINEDEFFLIDLNENGINPYKSNGIEYFNYTTKYLTKIENVARHSIIYFESAKPDGTHKEVYEELHTLIDKISYDYLILTGEIPKVNLISHSRGGLTSMMYATGYKANSKTDLIEYDTYFDYEWFVNVVVNEKGQPEVYEPGAIIHDHPFNVAGLYSMGTPYSGTDWETMFFGLAKNLLPKFFATPSAHNILDSTIQDEMCQCWENAVQVNPQLQLHAISGEMKLNFLPGLIAEDYESIINILDFGQATIDEICNFVQGLAEENNWLNDFITAVELAIAGVAMKATVDCPFAGIVLTILVVEPLVSTLEDGRRLINSISVELNDIEEKLSDENAEYTLTTESLCTFFADVLTNFMQLFVDVEEVLSYLVGNPDFNIIGSWGDLFIDTNSQLASNYSNVISFSKIFQYKDLEFVVNEGQYSLSNSTSKNFEYKKNIDSVGIPHNLETHDLEIINYILSNITLGSISVGYVYEPTSETTAALVGYRGKFLAGNVVLPKIINGYRINRIGTDLFKGLGQGVTKIKVPATVEAIDSSAFTGLNSLQMVEFETSSCLTTIGSKAFSGCTSLTSINIPNGVTSIGQEAFKNCTSLENITLPNNVKNIWDETFYGCESLVSVHILSQSKSIIDNNAFANCTSLRDVYFYSFVAPAIENNSFDDKPINFKVPYCKEGSYSLVLNKESYTFAYIPITINFYNENELSFVCNTYFGASIDFREVTKNVTKEGFVIEGWYDEDGNEYTRYTNDSKWAFTEVLNLYVRWQVENLYEQYPVTLDWGDGRISEITVTFDCPVVVDTLLTRQHYKFIGIYSEPDGLGTCYVMGRINKLYGIYQLEPESTANVWPEKSGGTLYAYWEPIVEQCTIQVLGTDVNYEAEETIEITSGTPITLNAVDYANGNAFSSWEINGTTYTTESVQYTFELRLNPLTGNYTIYYSSTEGGMASTEGYITLFVKQQQQCVATGTLITLADGRQVPVETLTGNEMLLVWNMRTGTFDVAPILFIDQDALATYKIINLQFSDGTQVKVISEHAFFDCNLNKYVYLREDAGKYIGHWFNKQTTDANGNLIWTKVQLTNVSITQEVTTAYSPVTYDHLCLYVNGMLSMPGGIDGLINIFEVDGETMQINQAKYLEDIATYGLFTYEEFYELYQVPEVMFEACGGQYLKVAIGKGLLDYERLGQLIERYAEFFA